MRNIPVVTRNLLAINCVVFLLGLFMKNALDFNAVFGLHFFLSHDFRLYQLFTYMFMHAGFAHLFFNMFALWMFGCVVENVWGANKFLFYYIVCGIGAGLCQEVAQYSDYAIQGLSAYQSVNLGGGLTMSMESYLNSWTTVGASGAIYGILLAFAMLFPENRIFIFPLPVPIKAKWFICIYVAVELFSALSTTSDGVAHIAHLGGMLFGFLLIRYWRHSPGTTGYKRNYTNYRKGNSRGWMSGFSTHREEKKQQSEIDEILAKIRRSGYDSLTPFEKQKLFDHSHHNS